ncbi:hypothetical protein NC651_040431 [Populus alba x Populus x berolinensis]|nr:hypothetical protein NC651_040431 [Populus alba x Populus x berolinensis]
MTNKMSFYCLDVELEDPKQKPSLSNPSIISYHQTQSLYFSSQISLITAKQLDGILIHTMPSKWTQAPLVDSI